MTEGGIEKKYPASTPSMATDGRPSNAWSSTLSAPLKKKRQIRLPVYFLNERFSIHQAERERPEIWSPQYKVEVL